VPVNFFWGEFLPLGQQKRLEDFVFFSVNLTKNELSFFFWWKNCQIFKTRKLGKM
jgi:hypothetical protein